jgi:hypothetical protein
VVIKGEGQNADKPGGTRCIADGIGEEVAQARDDIIPLDPKIVVQNKGDLETVGIDDEAGQKDE